MKTSTLPPETEAAETACFEALRAHVGALRHVPEPDVALDE